MENFEYHLIPSAEIPEDLSSRISAEVKDLVNGARIESVANDAEADRALNFAKQIKVFGKGVEEERKKLVQPLNEKVSEINSYFKTALGVMDKIERNIKNVIYEYTKKIEDQRLAALKAEQEEKKRLEDLRIKEAEKQELPWEDKPFEAEKETVVPPPVILPPPPPAYKASGLSTKTVYKAEVVEKVKFINWVIKNEKYGLIMVDQKALDKLASTEKEYFKADGAILVTEKQSSLRTA